MTIITGVPTDPADRVAGLLLDADDYILKPFDPMSFPRAWAGSFAGRARVDQTTIGTVAQTFRLRPAKTVRAVRLKVDAADGVGNEAAFTKSIRLK